MVATARGGGGGGVANGLDTERPPRDIPRFVPREGLRVGHTVHRGRQESRRHRKGSSGDPQYTGLRCGERLS